MNSQADPRWFPLSPAQRSRWFMYQWAPERQGQHNNVFVVRLRGVVDEHRLSSALLALVQRHPMLRARFEDEGGEPRQSVEFEAEVPLERTDASGWDDATLRAAVHDDMLRAFDIRARPPLRAHLYDRSVGETIFALGMDHLVSDGWSYWRLLAELGELFSHDRKSDEAGATYRDYISWQQAWMASPEAELGIPFKGPRLRSGDALVHRHDIGSQTSDRPRLFFFDQFRNDPLTKSASPSQVPAARSNPDRDRWPLRLRGWETL